MKGMLDPEYKEEILGKAEIRETFRVPNIGIIGGAYIVEGKVKRNAQARLVQMVYRNSRRHDFTSQKGRC